MSIGNQAISHNSKAEYDDPHQLVLVNNRYLS